MFFGKKDFRKGGVYADCWHIPGGGIDEGESQLDALKREVLEETGIDISNYKVELIDNEGRGKTDKVLKDTGEKASCEMRFFVYKVVVDDLDSNQVNIKLSDDLVEFTWVELSNLLSLKHTPPSIKLFRKLKYID